MLSMGTPCCTHQSNLFCTHKSCHFSSVPGFTKNSSSICSNSLTLKIKLRGVISFLKALPIWAMPKGNDLEVESTIFLKFVNIL